MLTDEYHPADQMKCPVHFCIGQEILPAFIGPKLSKLDYMMCHHRSHGYYLAKGGSLDQMVAELYGKESGANGGIGGSQELSSEEINFHSGAIMAGMFAMANGTAFASKYCGSRNISVAIIGDGGMEEGICWEAINLAATMNLPVIFLIENNQYSVHTPPIKRTISNDLSKKVQAFGIDSHKISTLDFTSLDFALEKAVENARNLSRPTCIELDTWRISPHVGPENDDAKYHYRDKELVDYWAANDPVQALRNLVLNEGANIHRIVAQESLHEKEIRSSIQAVLADTFPRFSTIQKFNFSHSNSPLLSQITKLKKPKILHEVLQPDTKLGPY